LVSWKKKWFVSATIRGRKGERKEKKRTVTRETSGGKGQRRRQVDSIKKEKE